MIKEFKIKDILNAVDTISKIEKKNRKISYKKDYNYEDGPLIHEKQAKTKKSEILVLNEMIE